MIACILYHGDDYVITASVGGDKVVLSIDLGKRYYNPTNLLSSSNVCKLCFSLASWFAFLRYLHRFLIIHDEIHGAITNYAGEEDEVELLENKIYHIGNSIYVLLTTSVFGRFLDARRYEQSATQERIPTTDGLCLNVSAALKIFNERGFLDPVDLIERFTMPELWKAMLPRHLAEIHATGQWLRDNFVRTECSVCVEDPTKPRGCLLSDDLGQRLFYFVKAYDRRRMDEIAKIYERNTGDVMLPDEERGDICRDMLRHCVKRYFVQCSPIPDGSNIGSSERCFYYLYEHYEAQANHLIKYSLV